MLPNEFPPWQNVYRTFWRWSAQGKFEQMHDRLRARGSTGGPDSDGHRAQSIRSSPQGGEHGCHAGKKVKGRKRHRVVATLGPLRG